MVPSPEPSTIAAPMALTSSTVKVSFASSVRSPRIEASSPWIGGVDTSYFPYRRIGTNLVMAR